MNHSIKADIIAGLTLFVIAAGFSVLLMMAALGYDMGEADLGRMILSAYGFCSVLIPAFLFAVGVICFLHKWTARMAVRLLTACVPFFTLVITESTCRAICDLGIDSFTGAKVSVTIGLGVMLVIIEYLVAGIIGDKLAQHIVGGDGNVKTHKDHSSEGDAVDVSDDMLDELDDVDDAITESADVLNDDEVTAVEESERLSDALHDKSDTIPPLQDQITQGDGTASLAGTDDKTVISPASTDESNAAVSSGNSKGDASSAVSKDALAKASTTGNGADNAPSATPKRGLFDDVFDENGHTRTAAKDDSLSFHAGGAVITEEEYNALTTGDASASETKADMPAEISWDNVKRMHISGGADATETAVSGEEPRTIADDEKKNTDDALEAEYKGGISQDNGVLPADTAESATEGVLDEDFFDIDMNDPDADEIETDNDVIDDYSIAEDAIGTDRASDSVPAMGAVADYINDIIKDAPAVHHVQSAAEVFAKMDADVRRDLAIKETSDSTAYGGESKAIEAECPPAAIAANNAGEAVTAGLDNNQNEMSPLKEGYKNESNDDCTTDAGVDASVKDESGNAQGSAFDIDKSDTHETEQREDEKADAAQDAAADDSANEYDADEDEGNETDGAACVSAGTAHNNSPAMYPAAVSAPPLAPAPIPLAEMPVRRARRPYNVPNDLLTLYADDQYWVIDAGTQRASATLRETLGEFHIQAEVVGIRKGPVVTMFELLPAPGVKLSKIVALQDNIALRLAASSVRIVAPIPGKKAVGIEIPNKKRSIVGFREIVEQDVPEFKNMAVPVILGKDILGHPQIIDLVKTPHLLIAGATGAGKSVCVNSMILSILYKRSPDDVKLILIDPKVVELKLYNDIPHLLVPVITETKKALQALQWALCEMERRYSMLDRMGCREIASYNKKIVEKNIAAERMPYIIIIIDEFADLMATSGKELESTVARLAAMSRAVGIHLALATQRPSIDVITGLIKANIPSRIAFMVASKTDSRIIIDQVGAEKLLGKGDMLYASAVDPNPTRIQGTFVSDQEVENVVDYVKQYDTPDYIDDEVFVSDDDDSMSDPSEFGDGEDPLYDEALQIVMQAGKASASYIQRRLKIGYNRAARLVEDMETRGIVGPANGSKPREIVHIP